MTEIATIILAGGEGTRLQPLTSTRCKPAVSFGGRYRIIDVALSNALNAGFENIYILSQFLASSLNNYILSSPLIKTFKTTQVEVLTPDITVSYQGTADAVRKNLKHILKRPVDYFVILSGDQLYSMDLSDMLEFAKNSGADLTIGAIPISENEARRMGVMKIDTHGEITDFFEKPNRVEDLARFAIPSPSGANFLGSMGIYIFKSEALVKLLEQDPREDFGKHIIPTHLADNKAFAYVFNGYWEDIGTIASYYEASLKLIQNHSCLDLYNQKRPIYSHSHPLPAPRIHNAFISEAILCDGCVIEAAEIVRSMVGMRTHIGEGSRILHSIIMGSSKEVTDPVRIGKHCHIEKVIIDEGASLGDNVRLVNHSNLSFRETNLLALKDGIIIVKAGAHIPSGFCISQAC